MGWAHNYKPASGILASGIPAGYISRGDGWGGPAKGADTGGPARAFTKDSPARIKRELAEQTPVEAAARKDRRQKRKAHDAAMLDLLYDLAFNAEREETQLSAAIAALDRLAGKPVAKTVNARTETTLEELILTSHAPKQPG